MKYYKILPFLFFSLLYFIFNDKDLRCSGLVDNIINALWVFFAASTLLIAYYYLIQNMLKTFLNKIISFLFFVYSLFFIIKFTFDNIYQNYDVLIFASNIKNTKAEKKTLLITKENQFLYTIQNYDFTCTVKGNYHKISDTFYLDKFVLEKIDREIEAVFIIKNNEIISVKDTFLIANP